MFKAMKKMTAFLMAMVMLLCAVPVIPAYAASIQSSLPKTQVITMHPDKKDNKPVFIGGLQGAKKVSVRTNRPSIITVSRIKYSDGIYRVFAVAKRPGVANIYTKADKKTYKTTVYVSGYSNPISYVKFGKTKISGNKFNGTPVYNLSYKKYAGKNQRVTVKTKKGWKIKHIMYAPVGWGYADLISNKGVFKPYGGKNSKLMIECVNPKYGIKETVIIRLK